MKNRYLFILFKLTILSWFLFLGFIFYQMFYPFRLFTVSSLTLPVFPKEVKADDTIYYTENYCKYVGNPGTVTHSLEKQLTEKEKEQKIQDIMIVFDTLYNVNVPLGCHNIVVPIHIPKMTRLGTYRIVKTIHIKVNQFRQEDLEFQSDWFKVI